MAIKPYPAILQRPDWTVIRYIKERKSNQLGKRTRRLHHPFLLKKTATGG